MRRTGFVVVVLLLLSGCSSDGDDGTVTPPSGTALTIERFAYSPTPLTVAPGATVSVTNKDAQLHTVTSDKRGLFKADEITQGATVSFTAPSAAGTYTFFCDHHANMHGTLVVKG